MDFRAWSIWGGATGGFHIGMEVPVNLQFLWQHLILLLFIWVGAGKCSHMCHLTSGETWALKSHGSVLTRHLISILRRIHIVPFYIFTAKKYQYPGISFWQYYSIFIEYFSFLTDLVWKSSVPPHTHMHSHMQTHTYQTQREREKALFILYRWATVGKWHLFLRAQLQERGGEKTIGVLFSCFFFSRFLGCSIHPNPTSFKSLLALRGQMLAS